MSKAQGADRNILDPEKYFYWINGTTDGGSSPQFEPRIQAIFHHPQFVEIFQKLPDQSKAVVMNILDSGGVSAGLQKVIRSFCAKEPQQPRFIQILSQCDWSGTNLETITDFVLYEIETGLQIGYML